MSNLFNAVIMAGVVALICDLGFTLLAKRAFQGQSKWFKRMLVSAAFSLTLAITYMSVVEAFIEETFATITF